MPSRASALFYGYGKGSGVSVMGGNVGGGMSVGGGTGVLVGISMKVGVGDRKRVGVRLGGGPKVGRGVISSTVMGKGVMLGIKPSGVRVGMVGEGDTSGLTVAVGTI